MTTTEDLFRSELAATLDVAADGLAPLDTADLLSTGGRRVRLCRAGAALLAAALIAGAVGVGTALTRTPPQTPVAVPASTSASPTTSNSPTAVPSTPAPITSARSGPLANEVLRLPKSRLDPSKRAQAEVWASDQSVHFFVVDAQGRRPLTTIPLDRAQKGSYYYSPELPDIVVGIGPANSSFGAFLDTGDALVRAHVEGTSSSDDRVSVLGLLLNKKPADPSQLKIVFWLFDGTPVIDGITGTTVWPDSAVARLWAVPELGIVGIGEGQSAHRLFPDDPRVTNLGVGADGVPTPTGQAVERAALLLLKGSVRNVAVTYSTKVTDEKLEITPWPALDATVVSASALDHNAGYGKPGPWPAITSVTWTDASGKKQSWTP